MVSKPKCNRCKMLLCLVLWCMVYRLLLLAFNFASKKQETCAAAHVSQVHEKQDEQRRAKAKANGYLNCDSSCTGGGCWPPSPSLTVGKVVTTDGSRP